MKKILIFLIILFSGLNCLGDVKSKVVGTWGLNFPVPSQVFGYVFMSNGEFYFYNEELAGILNRNTGSCGKWKVEKGKIYIMIEKDLVWEKPWKEFNGKMVSGDNKKIILERKTFIWEEVTDISTLKESNNSNIPKRMTFKIIINGKIFEKEKTLFKLNDGSDSQNRNEFIYKIFRMS